MKANATKYRIMRSRLIRAGTNPRRWALKNGLPVSTVYSAMRGERAGVQAEHIRQQIEAYLSGVTTAS